MNAHIRTFLHILISLTPKYISTYAAFMYHKTYSWNPKIKIYVRTYVLLWLMFLMYMWMCTDTVTHAYVTRMSDECQEEGNHHVSFMTVQMIIIYFLSFGFLCHYVDFWQFSFLFESSSSSSSDLNKTQKKHQIQICFGGRW